MLIFLVGFMGCGKSTIGRRVAGRIGYAFADMDSMIEAEAGTDIAGIFARSGEAVFREMETALLAKFDPADDMIIATGGGAPCSDRNISLMKERGKVVYFRMSPANLFSRLDKGRRRRPKIAALDDRQLMNYIERALSERERFYSQASMTIDCDGISDEAIASYIRFYIENACGR